MAAPAHRPDRSVLKVAAGGADTAGVGVRPNGADMGYAVHYRDAAGESKLEDVTSLEAAVELVERLRNEDGASEVRAFREVPLEVRTYYKVVALDEQGATGRQDPPPGAMPLAPPPVTVRADLPTADDGEDARRPGLFHR
jgi:hypothetical protein